MSFSILVCETDKATREYLKIKIESLLDIKLNFLFCNADIETIIGHVFVHQPHIVFIDIKSTKDHDRIMYDKLFKTVALKTNLVVTVAESQIDTLSQYADYGISHFLLKPLKNEAVKKTFNTLIKKLMEEADVLQEYEQQILVRTNRNDIQISQKDILIVESSRNICNVTLKDGTVLTVNENIGSISKKLLLKLLVKIDKSTIINMERVVFVEKNGYSKTCKMRLVNGEMVSKPISKAGMMRLARLKKGVQN